MRAITLLHLIGVCQATTSLQCWCALTSSSSEEASVLNRTSAPFQPYPITRAVCCRAIRSTPLAETFLLLRTLLPLRASECRTRVIREHFPVSVSRAFDGTKLPRSLLATISSMASRRLADHGVFGLSSPLLRAGRSPGLLSNIKVQRAFLTC